MKQTNQVYLIPTDKGSNIGINNERNPPILYYTKHRAVHYEAQHLYFTDDSVIKEGEQRLHINSGAIRKAVAYDIKHWNKNYCRKITATTNPELWLMAAKSGSKGPIYNIAKIPTSFIKYYIKNPIKEVELEYEEVEIPCPDGIEGCEVYHAKMQLKLTPQGEVIWFVKDNKLKEACRAAWWESKKDSQISVFSTGDKEAAFENWFDKNYPQ